jgi:hypothetical protein
MKPKKPEKKKKSPFNFLKKKNMSNGNKPIRMKGKPDSAGKPQDKPPHKHPSKPGKEEVPPVSTYGAVLVTSPAINKLKWTPPQALPADREIIYTYIDWGSIVDGVRVKDGGVQIYQKSYDPDVMDYDNTSWENSDPNDDRGNQAIPAGTWDIRVSHFSQVIGQDASTMDDGSYSEWLEDVEFT